MGEVLGRRALRGRKRRERGAGGGGLSVFPREHSATQLLTYTRAHARTRIEKNKDTSIGIYRNNNSWYILHTDTPDKEHLRAVRCSSCTPPSAHARTLHKERVSERATPPTMVAERRVAAAWAREARSGGPAASCRHEQQRDSVRQGWMPLRCYSAEASIRHRSRYGFHSFFSRKEVYIFGRISRQITNHSLSKKFY